jgi:uroporphyrin-III C-methyltransferase/precorrin-2 dehydrogenase/sirohydrochlorin ferrochelatase
VRLKGGDPFVFGRGGEEALALAEAGVPFEVVPGVSAAVAAPELAGIPVTHRGLASAFTVVSGHAESAWKPVLSGIAPGSHTIVVLMGLASRAAVAAFLLERGWAARTPVALLFAASTPDAFTWRGRLDTLGSAAAVPEGLEGAPATLVIGEVVTLASRIASGVPSVFPSKKSFSSSASRNADSRIHERSARAAQS